MSYRHIQKHVARPLVVWFENGFAIVNSKEFTFRKYTNMKMAIWHITTDFVVEGHILDARARASVCVCLCVCVCVRWGEGGGGVCVRRLSMCSYEKMRLEVTTFY